MKQRLARFTTSLALAMTLFVGALAPASAASTCNVPPSSSSAGQVLNGAGVGQTGGNDCGDQVKSTISNVVSLLSLVVGIAAVIMIIVSGLKYITSGGDSGRVSSAKSTLIYALVGVLIAALAQLLVHFVLSQAAST